MSEFAANALTSFHHGAGNTWIALLVIYGPIMLSRRVITVTKTTHGTICFIGTLRRDKYHVSTRPSSCRKCRALYRVIWRNLKDVSAWVSVPEAVYPFAAQRCRIRHMINFSDIRAWTTGPHMGKIHVSKAIQVNCIPPSAAQMRRWIGSTYVEMMACLLFGVKSLSKPVMISYQSYLKDQKYRFQLN